MGEDYGNGKMDSRSGTQPARCLVCGRPLAGRTDKKFCSDRCRNIYNNGRYRRQRKRLCDFNRTLVTNYYLLRQMVASGKHSCPKAALLRSGFDPKCFTASVETVFFRWYRCFDLRYRVGRKFVHLKDDENY
ncbi:MAG: DUF2116 family Zn-ribbon domain-containing protein [Bacteroidales bacterium]|nr:DUF2116 family Zn-ribbon domain-containing protein [Bacteroidales bacterium]